LAEQRDHWGSKFGFVLAAAGSAIGLGNIWKFPYVTARNGGGAFVLVYLACVVLVGLPVMAAEILLGRASQKSPVSAFRDLSRPGSPWVAFGTLGVAGSFVLLSYYSVVAGWALHYSWLSLTGELVAQGPGGMQALFQNLYISPALNVGAHLVFMGLTILVVLGGVAKGLERWTRILMPALLVLMLILLVRAFLLDGFGRGFEFVFGLHTDLLSGQGVLEALGQAFFTLSLGMGSMITYGSYLRRDDDIMSAAITISALDTLIALLAATVLFPIIFTYGMEPAQGPGLVFITIPIALAQMPAGSFLASVFFLLLVFAAVTSSISMLEVATSYFIDERNWSRAKATLISGGAVAAIGIPSALAGGPGFFGAGMTELVGVNWFDAADYLISNWVLPIGGLGVSLFTAWRLDDAIRHDHFLSGSKLKVFYKAWLALLRFVVPVAIVLVLLHAVGII
jgi:NSS family neurotransmitter:Na+ symporter